MNLTQALARHPRAAIGHLPTPLEPLANLGAELGLELWAKRDDLTGLAMGGNKVRQLEYYLGKARAQGASQVLITGAVQSNFVRTCAGMAAKLGMGCHIQLEDRVADPPPLYRSGGNVLLDKLLGATLHSFPEGENEDAADASLRAIAETLAGQGERPFIVPLAASAPPTGALGYARAAIELAAQDRDFDAIFVASGSALTHVGLLFGLRALGMTTPVHGICVRRDAAAQTARVARRLADLARLLDLPNPTTEADNLIDDAPLAPGYGKLSQATRDALARTARAEGLVLDPVYTAKTMAGLIAAAPRLQGKRVLFWHTGGQPALFAYGDRLGI